MCELGLSAGWNGPVYSTHWHGKEPGWGAGQLIGSQYPPVHMKARAEGRPGYTKNAAPAGECQDSEWATAHAGLRKTQN